MSMKIKLYCFVLAPCFGINAGCIPGFSEPIDADPVIENNGNGNSSESGSGSGLSSNVGGSAIPGMDRGTGVGAPAGGDPTGMSIDPRMFGAHTMPMGTHFGSISDDEGGVVSDDTEKKDGDGVMEPVRFDDEEPLVDPMVSGDGKESERLDGDELNSYLADFTRFYGGKEPTDDDKEPERFGGDGGMVPVKSDCEESKVPTDTADGEEPVRSDDGDMTPGL